MAAMSGDDRGIRSSRSEAIKVRLWLSLFLQCFCPQIRVGPGQSGYDPGIVAEYRQSHPYALDGELVRLVMLDCERTSLFVLVNKFLHGMSESKVSKVAIAAAARIRRV